jgi:hypothetical protein
MIVLKTSATLFAGGNHPMAQRVFSFWTSWCSASVLVGIVACSPTGPSAENGPPYGGNGGAGGGPQPGQQIPCNVTQVLQRSCHDCHGVVPRATPMSLVTLQDFHEASATKPNEKVFQRAKARINDAQDPMPPVMPLAGGDAALLDQWLDAGAPAGPGCGMGGMGGAGGSSGNGGSGASGGSSGTGGSGATAGTSGTGGTAGSGGEGGVGGAPADVECLIFSAHGAQTGGDTAPFNVGVGVQNLYQCFYFKSPWNVPVHGLTFKSVDGLRPDINDNPVIHHWLLYESQGGNADGSHVPCIGLHPDMTLLSGWAPGGDDWLMPPDVGMVMPTGANATYMLEVHYFNGTGQAVPDRSGVEVCVTKQLRKNAATVSWLGTQFISIPPNSPATTGSICNPNKGMWPITILRTWPHMHKYGRRMKTEITRSGGQKQMLINEPFDFDYQKGYPANPPVVLNPGDSLATTCEYQNTSSNAIRFGPETEQEMCYNFVVAYPARALTSAGLMANSCEF